jgi:nitrogen fixation NifU-like protein
MFDPETKKELIMEHYTHPLNRLTVTEKDFIKVNTNSESCIDNIDLFVKIEDGIIKDMYFNGEACAIST